MYVFDIYIEINLGDVFMVIWFCCDGDLEFYVWLFVKLWVFLVLCIKIMVWLDIVEWWCLQDGKIDFLEFGGNVLELCVVVMFMYDGLEDVVLCLFELVKLLLLFWLGLQLWDLDLIVGFL